MDAGRRHAAGRMLARLGPACLFALSLIYGGGPASGPNVARPLAAVVPAVLAAAVARRSVVATPAPILAAIDFPTPLVGYVVGDAGFGAPPPFPNGCPSPAGASCPQDGFILATKDGGRTWSTVYRGAGALFGLQAWDASRVIASGPSGVVITVDGGASWQAAPTPGPGSLQWASFPDPQNGWVDLFDGCHPPQGVNAGPMDRVCASAVYGTTDGGRDWRQIARTAEYPGSATTVMTPLFTGPGQDLGGGAGWLPDFGGVFVTRDDGATWTRHVIISLPSQQVFDRVLAPGVQDGWALGAVFYAPDRFQTTLLQTGDGGRSWADAGTVPDATSGLGVAPDGAVWTIADTPQDQHGDRIDAWRCPAHYTGCGSAVWVRPGGGTQWSQTLVSPLALLAVAPFDAVRAEALALAPDGRDEIVATVDGGQHWNVQYRAAGAQAPDVRMGFWAAKDGWGQGTPTDPLALLRTTDGGRTWARMGDVPPGTTDAVADPGGRVWARQESIAGGGWLFSNDFGGTWSGSVSTPTDSAGPMALSPLPPRGLVAEVYMRAGIGTVGTTDGGRWWSSHFPSPPTLWAAGFSRWWAGWALSTEASGTVERTVDGGGHWSPIARLGNTAVGALEKVALATSGPKDLWLVDNEPGFQVGDVPGPLLLHTADAGSHWRVRPLPPAVAAGQSVGAGSLSAISPQRAWLLTSEGLFATADGGADWSQVAAP